MQQPVDRSSVESFVERNADYYFEKWSEMSDSSNSRVSWNWAAALGGILWMLYRRLYAPFFVVIGVAVVDVYATFELEQARRFPVAVALWDKFSYLFYAAFIGSFGNYFYFRKFLTVCALAAEQSPDSVQQHELLSSKGGTNVLVFVIVLVLSGALTIWVLLDT